MLKQARYTQDNPCGPSRPHGLHDQPEHARTFHRMRSNCQYAMQPQMALGTNMTSAMGPMLWAASGAAAAAAVACQRHQPAAAGADTPAARHACVGAQMRPRALRSACMVARQALARDRTGGGGERLLACVWTAVMMVVRELPWRTSSCLSVQNSDG